MLIDPAYDRGKKPTCIKKDSVAPLLGDIEAGDEEDKPTAGQQITQEFAGKLLHVLYRDAKIEKQKMRLFREYGWIEENPLEKVEAWEDHLACSKYADDFYEQHKDVIDSVREERKMYMNAIRHLLDKNKER